MEREPEPREVQYIARDFTGSRRDLASQRGLAGALWGEWTPWDGPRSRPSAPAVLGGDRAFQESCSPRTDGRL